MDSVVRPDGHGSPGQVGTTTGHGSTLFRLRALGVPVTLAVVGCLVAVGAYRMGLGSLRMPGPGLWPMIGAASLVLLSVACVLVPDDVSEQEPAPPPRLLLLALGCSAGFIVAYGFLGVAVSAALALTAWFRFVSRLSWRRSVVTAVSAAALLHILFIVILKVPPPSSVLWVI